MRCKFPKAIRNIKKRMFYIIDSIDIFHFNLSLFQSSCIRDEDKII